MKRKQAASKLILTAFLAGMILYQADLTPNAASQDPVVQTEAQSAVSETPAPDYNEVFQVPSSAITSITNNAGHYGSSTISKAIDGNKSTHWETNKPNTATFHNAITLTLDKTYEIARMDFLTRQDGAKGKGFPLEYRLYYSSTDQGEDFQLLKEGSFSKVMTNTVTIEFPSTEVRRVKFEYVNCSQNWASASEIAFYKEDTLTKTIADLFTDNTHTALKEAYKNVNVLDQLDKEASAHPSRDEFLPLLKDARTILEQPDAFESRTFTASQRGNLGKEKKRTKINTEMYAFDSTGYYATPGETLRIYVEADSKGVMPKLVLGQVARNIGSWTRFYDLKPGLNIIKAPAKDKMNPAAIYISNGALPEDQAHAPRIRLEGGTKFPLYIHGKTTAEEFQAELEEYMKNVSYNDDDFANGNPNGYYYNIAEFCTDNCTVTTSAAGALKGIKKIVNNGSTLEEKMDAWEDVYFSYAKYSGFDLEDETSQNYRPRGKFMLRVFYNGPFAWAGSGYTGFNGGDTEKRDSSFYVNLISAASNSGWGVYHELGHIYDSSLLGRPESTNNLYALMMQDKRINDNRLSYEDRWKNHFTNYHNTKVYPKDQLFYGAFVYQLEAVYGRDLYGRASTIARLNQDNVLDGLTSKNDRLVVCLSLAAGVDLTYHYEYFQQPVSEKAKEKVAHLPQPGIKTYYVNDKYMAEDAAAFTHPGEKPALQVTGAKKLTLTMSMNEPDNSVLCYEIYRNGEFLGLTYGSTYVDNTCEPNTSYDYNVIAYDRKLNPSPMSDTVSKNVSEPKLLVTGNTTAAIHSNFDPLALISAYDVDGNDISSRIEVVENTVDTEHKGSYLVSYSVTDENGNSTALSAEVNVISTYEYASDLKEASAAVGYAALKKDTSITGKKITLLKNQKPVVYEKGLGAHANSEVVYQISDKNYGFFEAFVGIDQAMKNNKSASASFRVYIDGELGYDSGVMNSGTEAKYIKLDVQGASEIRLVTDGGANNGADHTVWADAKFSLLDSAPVIHAQDAAFADSSQVNLDELVSSVTAEDIEDGDLTSSIQYDTDYVPGLKGRFTINYRVSDSDGNETVLPVTIAVVNDFVYVSDDSWKSASVGWGSIKKDLSLNGNPIKLLSDEGVLTYGKGLGIHATSQVTYDLTGKDYYYFSSYVGVDQTAGNNLSSVKFQVYVDGQLVQETPVMRKNSPAEYLMVNITGAKELKLVVDAASNGNSNDHANWADAKFLTAVKEADKSELKSAIDAAQLTENKNYTDESWQAFLQTIEEVQKVYENAKASQTAVDEALSLLTNALNDLQPLVDIQALSDAIAFADKITDLSYVDPSYNHRQARFNTLISFLEKAKAYMVSDSATQEMMDSYTNVTIYHIEEVGQIYTNGGEPTQFFAE